MEEDMDIAVDLHVHMLLNVDMHTKIDVDMDVHIDMNMVRAMHMHVDTVVDILWQCGGIALRAKD